MKKFTKLMKCPKADIESNVVLSFFFLEPAVGVLVAPKEQIRYNHVCF